MPTEITAPLHLQTLINGHTYTIADFYATWCPPCKVIAPVYEQLATQHGAEKQFAFAKVNVDEQREIAAQYGIQAMPTFLVFKDGKVVETIKGANAGALKKAVEKAAGDVRADGEVEGEENVEQKKDGKKKGEGRGEEGMSMAERLGIKSGN